MISIGISDPYRCQTTNASELRFRAALTGDGTPKGGTTAFLEKGEPFRERSRQHSASTKGLGFCACQPGDHPL
jgi:hypothetical protein